MAGDLFSTIDDGAGLNRDYFVMNALATVIAAYGLFANSAAVVIGAMLLAMLLGPINGIGFALAHGHMGLFHKSLRSEVLGVLLVLGVSVGIGLIHHDVPVSAEMLARTRPNIFDMMIALAGGAGGAYALTSSRLANSIAGVAIATALVPPLATCGIMLARDLPTEAAGAFLLFLANFLAISFSAMLVFRLTTRLERFQTASKRSLAVMRMVALLLLVAMSVYLYTNFRDLRERQELQDSTFALLKQQVRKTPGARLVDVWITTGERVPHIYAVVRSPTNLTQMHADHLDALLEKKLSRPVILHLRHVPVNEIVAK
jgi:uncharacterized hydrophobic protein (TIGR00271 family)